MTSFTECEPELVAKFATGWSANNRVIWNDDGKEYDENKETYPNSE